MSGRDMDYVDFCYVPQHQEAMHARLGNWARWVRIRPHGWQTAPMFRMYISKARQWETPALHEPLDTLDAMAIEKAVSQLPSKHREATRWSYVFRGNPARVASSLGVNKQGLLELVCDARNMVKNAVSR